MKTKKNFKIEEKLEELFEIRTGVSIYQNPELRNENFFGYAINMPSREAVLLLRDIERVFEVSVSSEFVLAKKFTTFQNLLNYLNGVK